MPLTGSASVDDLLAAAPAVTAFAVEPLACPGADVLQVVHELFAGEGRESVLPPALHPVNPPTATWTFLRAPESGLGAFTLAHTRIVCRSGVRGRGYLVGAFVDSPAVAAALSSQWGVRIEVATVELERRYDQLAGTVAKHGRIILDVALLGPHPLSVDDLQYTDTMALATTPIGPRLIQVETTYGFQRAERGRPVLNLFDATAWGEPRLVPSFAISASAARADVTFEPVRFVCRPDELAFTATERVG